MLCGPRTIQEFNSKTFRGFGHAKNKWIQHIEQTELCYTEKSPTEEWVTIPIHMNFVTSTYICVRHYARRKILDVSVAPPKTCHHRPLGTPSRQLSGPIVASFGLRNRDTPKFCVRVIFDIYQYVTTAIRFKRPCFPYIMYMEMLHINRSLHHWYDARCHLYMKSETNSFGTFLISESCNLDQTLICTRKERGMYCISIH